MQLLTIAAPIAVLLLLGKWFSAKKLLSRETMDGIKYLVSNIMLPTVIFNALLNSSFTAETAAIGLIVYAVFVVTLLAGLALGKRVFRHAMTPFLLSGGEGGMLGYPLYIALYGQAALSTFLVVDLGNILFAFTFFIVLINVYNNRDAGLKKTVFNSLKSPLVILTALAIILNLTGAAKWFLSTPAGDVYTNIVSTVTAPITALVLLSVGYDMSFDRLTLKPALKGVAVRFAAMMAGMLIVWLLTRPLIATQELRVAAFLYFFLPPQFITPVFVKDQDERKYVSTVISMYALITLAAFVLITAFMPLH